MEKDQAAGCYCEASGAARSKSLPPWIRGLLAAAALYIFIASVGMIGAGLKTVAKDERGKEVLDGLFAQVSDPVTGLFIGLLVTSLVQSSSFTTSMTIGLVASGDLPLTTAIPVIMGANIGTSVTNLLVSMGNVRRRKEFRRALSGAIVHDFFNVLSVLVLLPLEYGFGIISRVTAWLADTFSGTPLFSQDPVQNIGVLKMLFSLPAKGAQALVLGAAHAGNIVGGAAIVILALVMLFAALWGLVRCLRGLMQDRLSGLFSRTVFRNPATSFTAGIIATVAVQSSSVTTSLIVPLVGAGVLKLKQIYPYTMGANIGTTVTAMLAALGTGSAPAMACAFGHLLFNLYGTAIFWPLQFIPISLAKGFAKIAMRRRYIAIVFLLGMFFALPLAVIGLIRLWR